MKRTLIEFIRRGLMACGFGPMVLVICYLVAGKIGAVDTLSVNEVCIGIVSISLLAFVAGGMNVIYQAERLPLMAAVLIHGGVLYAWYLGTYLINGWLENGIVPMLVFTGIFAAGYMIIWAVIYAVTKSRTSRLNAKLTEQQNGE